MTFNEETVKQNIARNITYYRTAAGDTQLALAEKLSYSDKSVSKWERGESTPDIFILLRIAELYGITIDDLLADKPKKTGSLSGRIYITVLSVSIAWLTAAVVFFFLKLFNVESRFVPMCFLYAVPVSMIIALVFSCIWFNRITQLIFTSALIWSLGITVNLTLLFMQARYIYIVCTILQLMTLLWFWYKYGKRRPKDRES